ncbi:MAG: hypothetical protein ACON4Y_01620 [Flavobacteriales bacterium]
MFKKNLYPLFLFILIACNSEDYIPETYVNFSIQASEIGGVGNAVYTNQDYGVNGIIIYHKDINEYLAFERTCSYEPSESCAIVELNDIYNPTILIDSCCGSSFFLDDGTPIQGPALLPLKLYNTSYDGVYVNVYN